ncbi:MAG TPA: acyl-CoA dehydrogenase family protein [Acidimicrobiales bacterium]|jgi:alkylation response protein AidB-like acyl-CoA dehydrogenase|nr:acyl-CoA dehydrogenase family protein [Acidimicrobiales bacterium]
MNFAAADLSAEDRQFWLEVHEFMDVHVTERVIEEEYASGAGMNEEVHRALGERGWLMPQWAVEDGGMDASPLQLAILNLELSMHEVPMITAGTTRLVAPAVARWGSDDLKDEVLPGVASGAIRFCLGYTEPDAGSDLAAVKTRAERDGDEWTVNGQKMFTTGAQNCQYCFLLTRTNAEVAKHKGLTMFLMPLASTGIEVTPIYTLGRERTNIVFYDEVRIDDRYRIGEVDRGWEVLNGPLSEEHEMGKMAAYDAAPGGEFTQTLVRSFDAAVAWTAGGTTNVEDVPSARAALARVAMDIELSGLTSGLMGRVASSELLVRSASSLVDVVGPLALLARGSDGAVGNGIIEYAHRYAQGTATYGGTTNIHRNLIAEQVLGLPRSRPRRSE